MPSIIETADEIAAQWGPALTKLIKGEGRQDFQNLFQQDRSSLIIDKDGVAVAMHIGTSDDSTMTWNDIETLLQDTEKEFVKAEAQCLGVLGKRMLLEVSRLNQNDEVYKVAMSVLMVNEDKKIVSVEAFGEPPENVAEAATS